MNYALSAFDRTIILHVQAKVYRFTEFGSVHSTIHGSACFSMSKRKTSSRCLLSRKCSSLNLDGCSFFNYKETSFIMCRLIFQLYRQDYIECVFDPLWSYTKRQIYFSGSATDYVYHGTVKILESDWSEVGE